MTWVVSFAGLTSRPKFSSRFVSGLSRLSRSTISAGSFRPDVGRLDDRPPFLNFGLVEGAQRLRGLLLARWCIRSEIDEALSHRRIGQCIDDRRIERQDDRARRSFRRPKSMPRSEIKSRQPRLIHRRNLRRSRQASVARHGKDFDPTRTKLRYRTGGIGNHQVDLPGDQILHRRGHAPIRYELKACAAEFLNSTPPMCPGPPAPEVPADALSGLAGNQVMNSRRPFAGTACFAA